MSYGRNPHYIWSDGEELTLEPSYRVPEYLINAFLYKLFLKHRRDDLKERLKLGKEQWMTQHKFDSENMTMNVEPQNQEYIDWMNNEEDELLKELLK